MKKLLIKGILLFLVTGFPLYVYLLSFADGRMDSCYERFTTGRKPSLVLGVSDCAQGIVPSVFNASGLNFTRPLYNFSFLRQLSPYGSNYLKVIKKKLDPTTKNGLFILGVNPWNVSILKDKNDDPSQFEGEDRFLARFHWYNSNPNLEYIFTSFGTPFYRILLTHLHSDFIITDDGLDQVNIPYDTARFNKSNAARVKDDILPKTKLSRGRFHYLEETILYLKEHGEVVLVRMPVSRDFAMLQEKYYPKFDSIIQNIADKYSLLYCNMIHDSGAYQTLDGTHLWKGCALQVSGKIRDMIEAFRRGRAAQGATPAPPCWKMAVGRE